MSLQSTSPQISVVLVIGGQRVRAEQALKTIKRQSNWAAIEVLLYDFGYFDHPPLAGADHPQVTIIPGTGLPGMGVVMAAAVFQAQAPIIAFVEEHTELLPGWGEALVRAYDGPWGAVGPEMLPGSPGVGRTDWIDMVSFGRWSPPATAGEVNQLRWQNVTYRRSALLPYGARLPWLFMSEGTLFQQLQADGYRLYLEPAAKMRHFHERTAVSFLYGNLISNWRSAAARSAYLRYNWFNRLLHVGAAMLGAIRNPVRLLTTLRQAPVHQARYEEARRHLPWIVVYYLTVSIGVTFGFLLGLWRSDSLFMDYELNQERIVIEEAV